MEYSDCDFWCWWYNYKVSVYVDRYLAKRTNQSIIFSIKGSVEAINSSDHLAMASSHICWWKKGCFLQIGCFRTSDASCWKRLEPIWSNSSIFCYQGKWFYSGNLIVSLHVEMHYFSQSIRNQDYQWHCLHVIKQCLIHFPVKFQRHFNRTLTAASTFLGYSSISVWLRITFTYIWTYFFLCKAWKSCSKPQKPLEVSQYQLGTLF